MVDKALFSSNSDEWETPIDLFNRLHEKFDYTLDAAASATNALCPEFFTQDNSALTQAWHGRVWCNPPYSMCKEFVAKALKEHRHFNVEMVTLLVPARTDTVWFQSLLEDCFVQLAFLKGRLRFGLNGHPGKNSAPFPSVIIHLRHLYPGEPQVVGWDWRTSKWE